jgi:hypothetical protein
LIGRFVLAFGDIENVTYLALYQLPKDNIFETTSSLAFGKRVQLVMELVANHPEVNDSLREKFIALLKKATKLSETRNHVAHSPLMMKVYHHEAHGWIHEEVELGNVRNRERGVSLKALRTATSEAEKLAKSLYKQYHKIHKAIVKHHDA